MTGAGILDCKKALNASDSIDDAVTWLRKNGLAKAAKKADRDATQGLVNTRMSETGDTIVIVEVNSETDFVSRNSVFQGLVDTVAECALSNKDSMNLTGPTADTDNAAHLLSTEASSKTILEDEVKLAAATVGENIVVRRVAMLSPTPSDGTVLGSYVHAPVAPGASMGQSAAAVALRMADGQSGHAETQALAKKICMHIVAASPRFLSEADVDVASREKEETILAEEARRAGKKEEFVQRVVQGRFKKYVQENCLLNQQWLLSDDKLTVAQVVQKHADTHGLGTLDVTSFVRFQCGQE